MSSARTLCALAASVARELEHAVRPGPPRTNRALEALLERLIGIAKRAKVLPSTPNQALLGPGESPAGPPFFDFVSAALDIAMDVIRSSPLPKDQVNAALRALSKVTDQSLVKVLERLRGRIGDYRAGTIGLVEWDVAESGE
jgi:hypothetical protein